MKYALSLSLAGLASAAVLSPAWTAKQDATEAIQPQIQEQQSNLDVPGVKRYKVRTGPYTLPSTKQVNAQSILEGVEGMMDTITSTPKPCDSDCTIIYMKGDLEYTNGTRATTADGSWLHHSVLFNNGPGRKDAACGIPGMDPFFSTGDERDPAYYADLNKTIDTGYHISSSDKFMVYSELMNMDDFPKEVYMVHYYDVIPTTPAMTKSTYTAWIEWLQCGRPNPTAAEDNIDIEQDPQKMVFTESSAPWTAPWDAETVEVSGHEHNGGTNLVVYKNDAVYCDTKNIYDAKNQWVGMNMDTGSTVNTVQNGTNPMWSISETTYCNNLGELKAGDKLHIDANYNFNLHKGMRKNNNALDEVMGISLVMLSMPTTVFAATKSDGLMGWDKRDLEQDEFLQLARGEREWTSGEVLKTGKRWGMRRNVVVL